MDTNQSWMEKESLETSIWCASVYVVSVARTQIAGYTVGDNDNKDAWDVMSSQKNMSRIHTMYIAYVGWAFTKGWERESNLNLFGWAVKWVSEWVHLSQCVSKVISRVIFLKMDGKSSLHLLVYTPTIFPADAQSFLIYSGKMIPEKLGPKSRYIFRFFMRKILCEHSRTLTTFFLTFNSRLQFFHGLRYCEAWLHQIPKFTGWIYVH